MTPSPRPRPSSLPPVQYKGGDLEAERGPGLGCFWIQLVVLAVLVVLTPVGVSMGWPDWLNALLLFATIGLLLVAGQTIIFLLRIVAAERREGRRRPMAVARSRTVGELEDGGVGTSADAAGTSADAAGPPEAREAIPESGDAAGLPESGDAVPESGGDTAPADAGASTSVGARADGAVRE